MEIKSEQGKLLRYCWGYDGGVGICVVVFEVVSVCYFLENGDRVVGVLFTKGMLLPVEFDDVWRRCLS